MNAEFNFEKAGYEAPADWARLWDLLPKSSPNDSEKQKIARGNYEAGGQKKPLMLVLLATYGVKPEPYNAEAAATRNVS